MQEDKLMRLSQAARILDVGITIIVEFLRSKGTIVESNPNTKINFEQIKLLADHFQSDGLKKSIGIINENKIINNLKSPVQKILFGSPGTGKSHKVENYYVKGLNIDIEGGNCIKTVFHPEYTYGDFMGKLMPLSDEKGNVTYNYYEGHFLTALSKAYRAVKENPDNPANVILVIDEINRGNSSSIFGSAFQLLDRNDNDWSSYSIKVSSMEYDTLIRLVFTKELKKVKSESVLEEIQNLTKGTNLDFLVRQELKLPPNLSIIGTMNSSDTSIYYMDSAFKRRWGWEYIDTQYNKEEARKFRNGTDKNRFLQDFDVEWVEFVDALNSWLKLENESIRKIEDKQIGYFFIKDDIITGDSLKNKLMFFLWDSVFTNNKKPIAKLINVTPNQIVTFGDFIDKVDDFCEAIIKRIDNV